MGDDVPGAAQTVVLSHGYWQRRFAGRPDIVGQSITIENVPHLVIGVLVAGLSRSQGVCSPARRSTCTFRWPLTGTKTSAGSWR